MTVNLLTDTVGKDITISGGGKFGPIKISEAQDTFSDIQNFIGSSGGAERCSKASPPADYNFTGHRLRQHAELFGWIPTHKSPSVRWGSHSVVKRLL